MTLLGASVTSDLAVDRIVAVKDDGLKRAITRLSVLRAYDTLALRNSLSVPQLLHSWAQPFVLIARALLGLTS